MSVLCQPLADVKFMKLLHTETSSSVDVTQDVISCLRENALELVNVLSFSEGEALCKAAEQGKSCFEGDNKWFVSAPELKSIIQKVVASMTE
ncbi:hypothetical protein HID58_054081 [Brassica napus]|uniref:Uncharacterized protein n=1 Tax=Brassica napus TaxID=3708 RepID=A0ABQ8AH75_BRANA|nr:hypothetical protein HID58_054081 [Brassica napus]